MVFPSITTSVEIAVMKCRCRSLTCMLCMVIVDLSYTRINAGSERASKIL